MATDRKKPTMPAAPSRRELIVALECMPEEAFGWFVAWAGGAMAQYPDGLGGFKPDSRNSILALRRAASRYGKG